MVATCVHRLEGNGGVPGWAVGVEGQAGWEGEGNFTTHGYAMAIGNWWATTRRENWGEPDISLKRHLMMLKIMMIEICHLVFLLCTRCRGFD